MPPQSLSDRLDPILRFLAPHALLLAMTAVLLWVVSEHSPLDQWVIAPYFDPSLPGFPLRENEWLELLNHKLAKYLVILFALLLGLFALTGRPRRYAGWRRDAAFLFIAIAAATATVSLLKQLSPHSCPWSLTLFGGDAQHFALFGTIPDNPGKGNCFPGGHASAGFALMALYFPLQRLAGRWAWLALACGFLYGFAMGWGQMVRGAHFLSHNLWSAWLVWAVAVVIAAPFYAKRRPL